MALTQTGKDCVYMKWLVDRPNLDKMSICIRERSKKGELGYSLTFSKSFKDYIITNNKSFIRFGYDVVDGINCLILQLNDDEIGLQLFNEKNQIRLWLDITSYFQQYKDEEIDIPLGIDLPVRVKKNGNLEVELSIATD